MEVLNHVPQVGPRSTNTPESRFAAASNSGSEITSPVLDRYGHEEQHICYSREQRTAWLAALAPEGRLPDNGLVVITIAGDCFVGRMVNGRAVDVTQVAKPASGGSAKPPKPPFVATGGTHGAEGSGSPGNDGAAFVRWCKTVAGAVITGVAVSLFLAGCR